MPVELECPACGGRGCDECRDGRWDLTMCPKRFVTADIWQVVELAELYEKGLPPEPGGSLDQSQSFVQAARFVWSERAHWKNKLGIMF